MKSWQLPDYISDVLPPKARQLEKFKSQFLDIFYAHGYQLVSPPLIEFSNSLLTNKDEGLSRKTFQFTDQLSGQQIGIRSDITTQITRIDAHLSAENSIHRFCYAGPTLHAKPQSLIGNREPLQIGAEIFGHQGVGADIEIIELMLDCMQLFPISEPMLSLSHIDIFNSLVEEGNIAAEHIQDLIRLLTIKASKELELFLNTLNLRKEIKSSLISLAHLYGHKEILEQAKHDLLLTPRIQNALIEIEKTIDFFNQHQIYLDFSELRTDRYHTGLLYGVYAAGWPNLLAKGGRYNNLGRFFGKARPATGFSFDLKDFLTKIPEKSPSMAIKINSKLYAKAREVIRELRRQGEIVIIEYEKQEKIEGIICNRQLEYIDNEWTIKNCD